MGTILNSVKYYLTYTCSFLDFSNCIKWSIIYSLKLSANRLLSLSARTLGHRGAQCPDWGQMPAGEWQNWVLKFDNLPLEPTLFFKAFSRKPYWDW